jgi:hypothetical protein
MVVPLLSLTRAAADDPVPVEGQPLAENAKRLLQALDFLGTPLPKGTADQLKQAIQAQDAVKIQKVLDPQVLVLININPEARVQPVQPAGRTDLLRRRLRRQGHARRQALPRRGPVPQPANDGEPERAQGRVRDRPDLQ